jgi:hypothetical protein
MAERERVKKAIEAPVDEATKLLDGSRDADVETRLAMRIDGWGRGLAAGLEELAIAIGELHRAAAPAASSAPQPSARSTVVVDEPGERTSDDPEPRGEDELRAEAERSREATATLREESETS